MANKKITERISLTSGQVNPTEDLLGIVSISAGEEGSKKITINSLFTGWGFTEVGEALVKAEDLQEQKDILGISNFNYDAGITGLTGGGETKLDGIDATDLDLGMIQIVNISGTLYLYVLTANTVSEDSPNLINPDTTPGNRVWQLWGSFSGSYTADYYNIGDPNTGITSQISGALLTGERGVSIADASGVLSVIPEFANSVAANAVVSVGDAWYDSTLKKTRVRLS